MMFQNLSITSLILLSISLVTCSSASDKNDPAAERQNAYTSETPSNPQKSDDVSSHNNKGK